MANALLYYRTEATKKSVTPDPNNLPPNQKIEFTFSDKMLEGAKLRHENNIKQTPFSNADGINKVGVQPNGLIQRPLIVRGLFNNDSLNTDVKKLLNFANRFPVDAYHVNGAFGFLSPNAVALSLDPDNTIGYCIGYVELARAGRKGGIYDFELGFIFGGTVANL